MPKSSRAAPEQPPHPSVAQPAARSPRTQELRRQIGELKRSWPAHSIPAAMLQRLEALEEELENELRGEG